MVPSAHPRSEECRTASKSTATVWRRLTARTPRSRPEVGGRGRTAAVCSPYRRGAGSRDDLEAVLLAEFLQRGHTGDAVGGRPRVAEVALPLGVGLHGDRAEVAVAVRPGEVSRVDEGSLDRLHARVGDRSTGRLRGRPGGRRAAPAPPRPPRTRPPRGAPPPGPPPGGRAGGRGGAGPGGRRPPPRLPAAPPAGPGGAPGTPPK